MFMKIHFSVCPGQCQWTYQWGY